MCVHCVALLPSVLSPTHHNNQGDTAALLPGPTAMSGRSFGSFDESPVKAAATPDGAAPPASRRSRQTDSTSLLQDATAETDVSVVMVEEEDKERL